MNEDEARRAKNREYARRSRARRRLKRQKGLAESDLTGDVVRIESVGSLLDEHMRRLYQYLRILEVDPSVSLLEKIRAFTSATGPLAKGVEALELRARIESLEARVLDSRRGRLEPRVVQ